MNAPLFIWVVVAALVSIIGNIWLIFWKVEKFLRNNRTINATNLTEISNLFLDSSKHIEQSIKSVTERLDQQQVHNENIPHHNTTFYFGAMGEAMNMNLEIWSLEIDRDTREHLEKNKSETIKFRNPKDVIGVLTIFLRKNKIIFDKFVLDLKNFNEKHVDYPIVKHGIELLKKSELNLTQLQFEMLSGFVEGVHAVGTIYHNQAVNLLISSFVQHVKPLYEAEKTRLEKEAADKKEVKSETSEVKGKKLEADQEQEKVDSEKKEEKISSPFPKVVPDGNVFITALARAITCEKNDSFRIVSKEIPSNCQIIFNGTIVDCPVDLLCVNDKVMDVVTNKKEEDDWVIIFEDNEIFPDSGEEKSKGLNS